MSARSRLPASREHGTFPVVAPDEEPVTHEGTPYRPRGIREQKRAGVRTSSPTTQWVAVARTLNTSPCLPVQTCREAAALAVLGAVARPTRKDATTAKAAAHASTRMINSFVR